MHLLDLTLDSPAANLALDEALLDQAEAGDMRETLRLWESNAPLVVVGRSSKPEAEVRLDFCHERNIPVLRRSSGGAAIVTGPGCLMYALVLSLELRPKLRSLDETHRFVLETMAASLNQLTPGIHRQGTSDLAFSTNNLPPPLMGEGPGVRDWPLAHAPPKKFSGNSLRVRRRYILYHGTLLYDFSLDLAGHCLAIAPRQPAYRAGRDHNDFIANLPIPVQALRKVLIAAWQASALRTDWPQSRVQQLLTDKYQTSEWSIEV